MFSFAHSRLFFIGREEKREFPFGLLGECPLPTGAIHLLVFLKTNGLGSMAHLRSLWFSKEGRKGTLPSGDSQHRITPNALNAHNEKGMSLEREEHLFKQPGALEFTHGSRRRTTVCYIISEEIQCWKRLSIDNENFHSKNEHALRIGPMP
jgi:hypothetical protein